VRGWALVLLFSSACGSRHHLAELSDAGATDAGSDGGASPDAGVPDGGVAGAWLRTSGNHILAADGGVWHGRGANLADTRGCNACTAAPPDVGEVLRRADELIDNWKANFVRLDLESYAASDGYRVPSNYKGLLDDAAYLADVQTVVRHITAKGAYVLLSLWEDTTFTTFSMPANHLEAGWPTASTNQEWRALASAFKDEPRVLFGICNEPQSNFDHALDPDVWSAMQAAVAAIRSVEDAAGTPHHIVTVQGTGGWARFLGYYVAHPIPGDNVAYEVHVYNPAADFAWLFEDPAKTLPVVIGEFGPQSMSMDDVMVMLASAELREIPHLAWTFHMRCPPNLLVDLSNNGCGVGMALTPTPDWGRRLKDHYAAPW
jgi:endoglucanase